MSVILSCGKQPAHPGGSMTLMPEVQGAIGGSDHGRLVL